MKARILLSLFGLLLINQSCTVYQKTSVPLNQAYDNGMVKVKSKSGEVFLFYNIKLEDGLYYGLTKDNIMNKDGLYTSVEYYIPLTDEQVDSIYLKDPKRSKRRSILFATSPVIIVGSYLAITIILLLLGIISIV